MHGFDASDKGAGGSVVILDTWSSNLARDRDKVLIDEVVPSSLKPNPNENNEVKLRIATREVRAVQVRLNDQQLKAWTWLVRDNRLGIADFHY